MIFVCGTDTGVGKTHVSAAILHRWKGLPGIRYWKPVQTGMRSDTMDEEVVRRLTGLPEKFFVPTFLEFQEPLSPHRAAELEGRAIDLEQIIARLLQLRSPLIVEGAGGLLVPLNRKETWIDFLNLARDRGCPVFVVIAARSGLGTINHSLLTIERLRLSDHKIAGIVFCGPESEDNRRTVCETGRVADLGSFDFRTEQDLLLVDPAGILEECLRPAPHELS